MSLLPACGNIWNTTVEGQFLVRVLFCSLGCLCRMNTTASIGPWEKARSQLFSLWFQQFHV